MLGDGALCLWEEEDRVGTLESWLEVLNKGQTLPWGPPARQPQATLDRAGGRGEGG